MKQKILDKNNIIHIGIIVLGTILLLISAFHSNIWFDESYSVSIVNHSFSEIWTIGSADVHPILYYWILKIVSMIFGANIIIYRLFSVLGIVVLATLGLTHIKKDFGTKAGMLFTFFSMFLPVMLNYALEIRMYSWTITTVTLMTIYAYRFIKQKDLKNAIFFGIFSIISCYMHYFALMCAGILNLALIIYVIKNKNKFERRKVILEFFIIEAIQVLIYIPGLIVFASQALRVGKGFWITVEYPQILIDIVNFQFKGSIQDNIPTIVGTLILIYVLYIIIKNIKKKEDILPGIVTLSIYALVIIVAAIVSIISPILYARYLFPITGLYIFAITYFITKEDNKFIIGFICGITLIMSIINLNSNIQENYDSSNNEPIQYLKENVQSDDIVVYPDMGVGGVTATLIDNKNQYFMNMENWSIEEAYKAYAPQMGVAYNFQDLVDMSKGRIVLIDPSDNRLYNKIKEDGFFDGKCTEISSVKFNAKYKDYTYNIRVLEVNKD